MSHADSFSHNRNRSRSRSRSHSLTRAGGEGGGGPACPPSVAPSSPPKPSHTLPSRGSQFSPNSTRGRAQRAAEGRARAARNKAVLLAQPACEQVMTYNHNETTFSGPFRRTRLATTQIPRELKYKKKDISRYGYLSICSFRGSNSSNSSSVLRDEEIEAVLNFLDENGDGELSSEEIITAVRRYKRMDSKNMAEGKKMMHRLLDYLAYRKMSVEEWFDLMDGTSVRKGDDRSDGKITTQELMRGMLFLFKDEPDDFEFKFCRADVEKLQRFLDPNGDGDVSLDELLFAVTRLDQTAEEMAVAQVLQKLNEHVKTQRITLVEFFEQIDTSGDGVIDSDELREGLRSVTVSLNEKADRKNTDRGYRESWHQYFCTVNKQTQELMLYPVVNRFVTGNTGKQGFELHVRLVPERKVDLTQVTLSLVPAHVFSSKLVFKLDWPTSCLYCCAADHMELCWWQKALHMCRVPSPQPVCVFGGRWCAPPYTRRPDDFFQTAPWATTTTIACCKCFLENDENRRRERQAHLQYPVHAVDSNFCQSAKAESWRTLPPPSVMANPVRADCILHVEDPWQQHQPFLPTGLPAVPPSIRARFMM